MLLTFFVNNSNISEVHFCTTLIIYFKPDQTLNQYLMRTMLLTSYIRKGIKKPNFIRNPKIKTTKWGRQIQKKSRHKTQDIQHDKKRLKRHTKQKQHRQQGPHTQKHKWGTYRCSGRVSDVCNYIVTRRVIYGRVKVRDI